MQTKMQESSNHHPTISVRVAEETKTKIRVAAALLGKSVSQFVLELAVKRAEDVEQEYEARRAAADGM